MLEPMLASKPKGPESFDRAVIRKVNDPGWGMDIKIDGKRLVVDMADRPSGFNRSGGSTPMPAKLTQLFERAGAADVLLDGELVRDTLWLFDLQGPAIPGPWEERRRVLDAFVEAWDPDPTLVRVVPWSTDQAGKARLAQRVLIDGLEGLVAKRIGSTYHPGKRSTDWVKLKHVKTVDCFVTRLGVDGKQNMALGLWRDGEIVEVGEVSALTGDGPSLAPGMVCTVTFLYLGVNDRLVQPVRPIRRTDKLAEECDWDQLPPTPKEMA